MRLKSELVVSWQKKFRVFPGFFRVSRFREPGGPETRKLVNKDSNYHVVRGVVQAFAPRVTLQRCLPWS